MILILLKSNRRLLTSHHGRSNLLPIQIETQRAFHIGTEYVRPCKRQTLQYLRSRMSKRVLCSCRNDCVLGVNRRKQLRAG